MQERIPLSKREYHALRQLFGIVSIFHSCGDELKGRLRGVAGGWRDLRLIQAVSDRLLRVILTTVPPEKLAMLRRELTNTVCEVTTRGPVGIKEDPLCCVETGPLERMMIRAGQLECFACEKKGKKARACLMRKDLVRLLPWGYPEIGNGDGCPFADSSIDKVLEEFKDGNQR